MFPARPSGAAEEACAARAAVGACRQPPTWWVLKVVGQGTAPCRGRRSAGRFAAGLLALVVGLVGCVGPATPPPNPAQEERGAGHLILATGLEPRTLVPSVGSESGGPSEHLFEAVHQSLVTYDAWGRPVPRVARSLPSLEDGSWRVNPDGTMDTVWTLREGVRWHDGRPLTAADVVFSWRVFNSTAVPVVSRRVVRLIESMETLDDHSVRMRWRSRYAFANQLSGFDLTLLPGHLLEASLELRPQQLAGHAYWNAGFVGLGPYRLTRWIAGSSLELKPFPEYFLGHPRLDHISVRFLPDDNAAMASVLSGNADVLLPRRAALGIIRGVRGQWGPGGEGTLSILPGHRWLFLAPQFGSPQPEELRDGRLREALAQALDRRAIAEAITGDGGLEAPLWIPAADPRHDEIARGLPRHDYSPERALDLFREAGWRREGPEDTLVKHGQRFDLELTTISDWHLPAALVAEHWRQIGVPVKESVVSLGSIFDRQRRSTYSGVELAGGIPTLALLESRLRSSGAPSAENFWVGANRGHYANREMDGLLDRLWQVLEPAQVASAERDIARFILSELPIIGVLFYPSMAMVRAEVRHIRPPETVAPMGRLLLSWNAHEWEKGGVNPR